VASLGELDFRVVFSFWVCFCAVLGDGFCGFCVGSVVVMGIWRTGF
jgi:tetrahydromethanopterin S-methyltransferase subunit E